MDSAQQNHLRNILSERKKLDDSVMVPENWYSENGKWFKKKLTHHVCGEPRYTPTTYADSVDINNLTLCASLVLISAEWEPRKFRDNWAWNNGRFATSHSKFFSFESQEPVVVAYLAMCAFVEERPN